MTTEINSYHTYSIFYDRDRSSTLLNEIARLVDVSTKAKERYDSHRCLIFLRDEQGEHIVLMVPISSHDPIGSKLLSNLEIFLKTAPSPGKFPKYPASGLFMDHPNNSVIFHLNLAITLAIAENTRSLRESISSVLSQALQRNGSDEETIYVLLIYIQFSILKAATRTKIQAVDLANEMIAHYSAKKMPGTNAADLLIIETFDQLHASMEKDIDSIADIIDDVWDHGKHIGDMAWMSMWLKVCSDELITEAPLPALDRLSKLFYEHLGFNNEKFISYSCSMILKIFVRAIER